MSAADQHKPVTIVHTADLHLGRRHTRVTADGDNVRENDIYAAADTVSSWITNDLRPDVAVIAGDVWDVAQPTPVALRHGYDFHARLREAQIPTIVIGGNHDTLTTPGRPSPLQHLERYFGVHLTLEQEMFECAGLLMHTIPYRSISTGEVEEPQYDRDAVNVLVGHANVDDESMPDFSKFDSTKIDRSALDDPRLSLGMLGHIHIHQKVGRVSYYSGALERLTWGELIQDPAVYVHRVWPDGSVETQTVRVAEMGNPNVPRDAQLLAIEGKDMEPSVLVDQAIALIDSKARSGALVQLNLNNAPATIHDLPVAFDSVLQKRAANRDVFALKTKVNPRPEDDPVAQIERQSDMQQIPGGALSEAYRLFVGDTVDQDLADLGVELIAVATGEIQGEN